MRRLPVILIALIAASAVSAGPASAAEQRFKLRAGPYEIGRYETSFPSEEIPTPKVKGFVTDLRARMVDSRGRVVQIDDAMLHHVFFNNLSRRRYPGNCSGRPPEVFYGTGEENQSMDLPEGYGYRLRRNDRWKLTAMLMSHRYRPGKVYIEYSGTVDTNKSLTAVRPFWVRANGCGSDTAYHVRGGGGPGSVDDRVFPWKVPMTGRIVASGGHLHAGAINLELRDPACGDRVLLDNRPFYAPANDLVYNVVPFLHEAGPVQTSWFKSAQGIPVTKGQVLNLHGLYENQYARQSVMSITHIYIAPTTSVPPGCPPIPADAQSKMASPGLRTSAPYKPIPLYSLDERHLPVAIAEPPGAATPLPDGATIELKAYRFQPSEKVVIKAGSTINWRFADKAVHNLTLASGPRAVAGQELSGGARSSTQFTTRGRYQLFCYLHPMTMHLQIDVV